MLFIHLFGNFQFVQQQLFYRMSLENIYIAIIALIGVASEIKIFISLYNRLILFSCLANADIIASILTKNNLRNLIGFHIPRISFMYYITKPVTFK